MIKWTIFFALVSCNTLAQSVTGWVKDLRTSAPISDAVLTEISTRESRITNEQGFFMWASNTDSMTIEVRHMGYISKTVTLLVDHPINIFLEESVEVTKEIIVRATRATYDAPVASATLDRNTIVKQNFGQDLPLLLNWTPSLTTTSDAGNGVGYTGMRIRGSDATRINVTINGIPLNDSEEHGVFWVDIPDVAASTQSVQIQRGVGTSTNGAGAFGASVNVQTNTFREQPYAEISNTYGSFGTHKHAIGVGSGSLKNFAFDARVSLIKSDGFIDRATSNLKSYYLSAGYYGTSTMVKVLSFGGREITYQSWYGVPQSRLRNDKEAMLETALAEGWNEQQTQHLLNSNSKTFNIYTYPDQVDNYGQDHHQIHLTHQFTEKQHLNLSLHYTHGKGFYEEYKHEAPFSEYAISPLVIGSETITSSDLVRRRWLDNHFYGATFSYQVYSDQANMIIGGAVNQYIGHHFGQIVWAQHSTIPKGHEYYRNRGDKKEGSLYWKTTWLTFQNFKPYIDLQYRCVRYDAAGDDQQQKAIEINRKFHFFNPKVGVTYTASPSWQLYMMMGIGRREPVRSDYINNTGKEVKPEILRNVEAGFRHQSSKLFLNVNAYYMQYKNQLVLTGEINDVGASVRKNVPNSYRLGVELDASVLWNQNWQWQGNVSWGTTKIKSFVETIYDYGKDFSEYRAIQINHPNTTISFSPSLIAHSTLLYKPIRGIECGWLSKFVSKQYLDNTSNGNRKIDPYWINDLRMAYILRQGRSGETTLSFLINNVFNVEYSSNGYTWGYKAGNFETRQNYFYPQAGRNFMIKLDMKF